MIANAHGLRERFPTARVQVYIAEDVPADIHTELASLPNVCLVPVPRRRETANTLDRFRAFDDVDCEVMFVRDADSRVHARDAACIEDFLASPAHILHIIRDHRFHTYPILAGMWGLRKNTNLLRSLTPLVEQWLTAHTSHAYLTDQHFLRTLLYPRLIALAMVHDRCHSFDPPTATRVPFRIPIEGSLFVGQVHKISDTGDETLAYDP
jgi:hypothetical protein